MTVATTGDTMAGDSFTITAGNGGGEFSIAGGTGVISTTGTATDHEGTSSYTLTISVSDGTGQAVTEDVTITIDDVNEAAPVFTVGDSAAANVAETTTVGTYTATDADGTATQTYSITGGEDSDLFSIASDTGVLTFSTAPDYEAPGCGVGNNALVCTVILTVTDGANTDTTTITATITDLNEATPEFSDGDSISVDVAEGTTAVGTYTATDADGSATQAYSITGGQDSGLFSVVEETGVLTFSTAPDYETPGCGQGTDSNTCEVVVTVTDGVNTDTITVTVSVTDMAPIIAANQAASIDESASNDDDVMTVSTTGDAATAFIISNGNSDGIFKISSIGLIEIADNTNLDYEDATTHTLTIIAGRNNCCRHIYCN